MTDKPKPEAWTPGDLLCWNIGGEPACLVSPAVNDAGRTDRLSLIHLFHLNGEPTALARVEHEHRSHYDFIVAPDFTVLLPRRALLSKQELRRDGLLTEWHDAAVTS